MTCEPHDAVASYGGVIAAWGVFNSRQYLFNEVNDIVLDARLNAWVRMRASRVACRGALGVLGCGQY